MVLIIIPILLCAALIPIILLGLLVYLKDANKEPHGLLLSIFFMGFLSALPIVIGELLFDAIIPLEKIESYGLIAIFLHMLVGVTLFEEGFKWLITYFFGYINKAYDEVFDIIVYAVFASLGFACIENIIYVFQNGLSTAILRAIISVPGHVCFAITMGYFFSKAKKEDVNKNKYICILNMIMSILFPMILHALYDALLYYVKISESIVFIIPFLVFFIIMVIICFLQIDKIAKIKQSFIINGENDGNISYYKDALISFCPACGNRYNGGCFCRDCGFRLK